MPQAQGKHRKDLPRQKVNHIDNSMGKCRCRICYSWKMATTRKFAQVNAYHAKALKEAVEKERARCAKIAEPVDPVLASVIRSGTT